MTFPLFLFTDIENSTRLWEKYPEDMPAVLELHDSILERQVGDFGGRIIKHTGDGMFAVFEDVEKIGARPLRCVLEIQSAMQSQSWPGIGELRIRMGLHQGDASRRGADYFGPGVNRAARIMGVAWGGQIVLSEAAVAACALPESAELEDLGSHRLKDLSEPVRIFQLSEPGLKIRKFPVPRSLSARPHNLSAQAGPFVGRESDIKSIKNLFRKKKTRMITLAGAGGTGKTRLALQLGAELIEDFEQGVFLVQLAPLESAELMAGAIADSLGFSFYEGARPQEDQLLDYLLEKNTLLILDNFEHILAGAEFVGRLLENVPGLSLLVTSRSLLRLREEHPWPLQGLEILPKSSETPGTPETPGDFDCEALRLFTERAARAGGDFVPDETDLSHILEICRIVEGMPLAIELCAAWTGVLKPGEIVQELKENLDFLESRLRDIPERHRSLRAVFEYSWKLLEERERDIFKKLSYFRGGFERKAAKVIIGAGPADLLNLVEKSLLRKAEQGRYELQELTRQFAWQQLEDDDQAQADIRAAHSRYFLEFLVVGGPKLKGPEQKPFLKEIDREIENIRRAWEYSLETGDGEFLAGAEEALAQYFERRNYFYEGRERFDRAREAFSGNELLSGALEVRAGRFYYLLTDYETAHRLQKSALERMDILLASEDPRADSSDLKSIRVQALGACGFSMYTLGQKDESKKLLEEAVELSRELKDDWLLGTNLYYYTDIMQRTGELAIFRESNDELLRVRKRMGDTQGLAEAIRHQGVVEMQIKNMEKALDFFREYIRIQREEDFPSGVGFGLQNLAYCYGRMGDFEKARKYTRESLEIYKELGVRGGQGWAYLQQGWNDIYEKDFKSAGENVDRALEIFEATKNHWAFSWALSGKGDVLQSESDLSGARASYLRGLDVAWNLDARSLVLVALQGVSELLLREGREEESLRILAQVLAFEDNFSDKLDRAQDCLEVLREKLSPEKVESILARSKTDTIEEIIELARA